MKKLSCAQAKQLDMVDYLASLGHQPIKIARQDYWFLSPFRNENSASFKVNRKLNVWFDFGEGKGGDLLDFGKRYHNCSINELLEKLAGHQQTQNFSFHPPKFAGEKKDLGSGKILILEDRRLAAPALVKYLEERKIPIEIAEHFCREIDFLLYQKRHTAIGFQNNSGGYELRNPYFKGSNSPKDVSFFDHGRQQKLTVFEGFFNYLSFHSIIEKEPQQLTNFLVLNSLSFFEKSREKMETHQQVHLFLDRDPTGSKFTQKAIEWDKARYIDRSHIYQNRKDLNDWLIKRDHEQKQSLRIGRHF